MILNASRITKLYIYNIHSKSILVLHDGIRWYFTGLIPDNGTSGWNSADFLMAFFCEIVLESYIATTTKPNPMTVHNMRHLQHETKSPLENHYFKWLLFTREVILEKYMKNCWFMDDTHVKYGFPQIWIPFYLILSNFR